MTNVVIACPTCQQKIRAPRTMLGRAIKCPQCRNPFTALDPNDITLSEIESKLAASAPANGSGGAEPTSAEETVWGDDEEQEPKREIRLLDFLWFRRMVTPPMIVVVFYIGLALQLLAGIALFILGFLQVIERTGVAAGIGIMVGGVLGTLLSSIFWRILCEVLVTFFRIHDRLSDISEKRKP